MPKHPLDFLTLGEFPGGLNGSGLSDRELFLSKSDTGGGYLVLGPMGLHDSLTRAHAANRRRRPPDSGRRRQLRAGRLVNERHRRSVALELAKALHPWVYSPTAEDLAHQANRLLNGARLDVYAAREHANTLIALEVEQAVFEDWCRGRGLGPENREPGAFGIWCGADHDPGSRLTCGGVCAGNTGDVRGGWPGNLAREWSEQGHDRRAPMGRSLARLGRRVLRALEGQPSECQSEGCDGGLRHARKIGSGGGWNTWACSACKGTGHNLRGYLPEAGESHIR